MYSRLEIVELWWRYWAGWLNFSDDEPDVGEGHSEADSSDTYAEFHPADLDFYGYQYDSDLHFFLDFDFIHCDIGASHGPLRLPA